MNLKSYYHSILSAETAGIYHMWLISFLCMNVLHTYLHVWTPRSEWMPWTHLFSGSQLLYNTSLRLNYLVFVCWPVLQCKSFLLFCLSFSSRMHNFLKITEWTFHFRSCLFRFLKFPWVFFPIPFNNVPIRLSLTTLSFSPLDPSTNLPNYSSYLPISLST